MYPNRTANIDNLYSALTKEQPVTVRTSLAIKSGQTGNMVHGTGSSTAQTLTPLNDMFTDNRVALSNSPLPSDMQQLLGSVEYTDTPNAPIPIPGSALAICKEGI